MVAQCGTAASGELWKLYSHNIFIIWRCMARITCIIWATVERLYQKRGFCVRVWALLRVDRQTDRCFYVYVCTCLVCQLPVISVCTQVCVYIFLECLLLWTVTVFWSWFHILSLKLSSFGRERIQITCFAQGLLNLAWLFTKTTLCKPDRFPVHRWNSVTLSK